MKERPGKEFHSTLDLDSRANTDMPWERIRVTRFNPRSTLTAERTTANTVSRPTSLFQSTLDLDSRANDN